MGLKPFLSFSTGELDPILHDNVTLEKFKKGLDTARNVIIGKTGTIMSRFATAHFVKAKNNGEKIKLFSPPNSGILTEWGNLYVRVYDFDGNLLADVAHTFTETDLDNIHFEVTSNFIYAFVTDKKAKIFNYDTYMFQLAPFIVPLTSIQINTTNISHNGNGYNVDYAYSLVYNGEEYCHYDLTSLFTIQVPSASGQFTEIKIVFFTSIISIDKFNEVKVYRRPTQGSAFGFIGSTNNFEDDGTGHVKCSFVDLGGNADFTNGVISIVTKHEMEGSQIYDLNIKTGVVYQQRLLISPSDYSEGILASRPGFQNNFYRDFPYDADSSLNFKSGTSGTANILRMIDNDGLIIFTTIGIYVGLGLLSIDNISLVKKGSWIIDESIPPLSVPGGVFFVDKSTNSILQFIYSDEIGTYQSLDHSIFNNHLFTKRKVTSWAFQSGINPLIIVSFSDGTFATFTYNFEHQMRAWTRHDSIYPIEQVEGTGLSDTTFFVTNKNGNRYITMSLPRKIPVDTYESNTEADKLALNFLVDAAKSVYNLLNDSLIGSDEFVVVPVIAGNWEGNLTLTCGTSGIFTVGGSGDTGTIFRVFDPVDKTVVDLTVISRTDDNEVIVKPSCEFPSDQATGFNLYIAQILVTSLDHLEGEKVAVIVDGAVLGSPNNDEEIFKTYTVVGGSITLDESDRGAIIIVGRPITADVKTLNISTVEQKPTLIESVNVNKVYIRVHETRGLYIDNQFPEEKIGEKNGSTVKDMEDMETYYVPDGCDIVGNRYKQPVSKRIEKTLPGNWKSNGKVAIRQVDPLHFEILSIIPDTEVLWRSDR